MAKQESKELTKPQRRELSPFEEIERRFEDIFRRPFSLIPSWPRGLVPEMEEVTPTIDMYEEGDDIVIKAELPGIKKEDIGVDLSDGTVVISGEKKQEEKIEKKNFYRLERSYGSFRRTVPLPAEIQPEKIKAKFSDGVLEIRAPKTPEAKEKAKKVTVD